MESERPVLARIRPGTFAAVIRDYMMSPKFQGLAASTRTNYGKPLLLAQLPEVMGDLPVREIRPYLIQQFLDELADRPAAQKSAQTALKAVEKFALVRNLVPHPFTIGTEAPGSQGGHEPWTEEQIALAEREARPHLSRVITLAANTGQRGSDLVRMRWSDIETYEGRPGINVTQKKTGLRVWVPFTARLQAAMENWKPQAPLILLKEDGQPWTREQLSNQWVHERNTRPALAPIKEAGLRIHGLRASACVRLRRAGASVPLIADMVGLSTLMVARYCRLSDQRDNALAAVHILDRTALEQARTTKRRFGGASD